MHITFKGEGVIDGLEKWKVNGFGTGVQNNLAVHPKVSAVLITLNEEGIIEETLSKLYWCDEIVVVDSGSSDQTLDICRKFGCKIYYNPFEGFGVQKQFAVGKASNDWVLSIDADEVLSDDLVKEIQHELRNDNHGKAFEIPRKLIFLGQPFRYGKESKAAVVRLFNKQFCNWNNSVVHEKVAVKGKTKVLHHCILHYSHKDYSDFISKINLYSTLNAEKLSDLNLHKNRLIVVLALPFNFFKYYFLDRNFLNGYKGFCWAILNTCYHFLKYLKLEELQRQKNKKRFTDS